MARTSDQQIEPAIIPQKPMKKFKFRSKTSLAILNALIRILYCLGGYHEELAEIETTAEPIKESPSPTQETKFELSSEVESYLESTRADRHSPQPGSWIVITNDKESEQALTIEPFIMTWPMRPKEKFRVYLKEPPPHQVEIEIYDGGVVIYASEAIVYKDEERLTPWSEFEPF